MQSSTTSVRTSLPPRAFLCADSVTRPLCDDGIGSRVPMYRPLCADRVRFPRHVNRASYHPTQTTRRLVSVVCFCTALEYRCLGPCVPTVSALVCRPCAVSPPLTLGAFALATGRLSLSALVCLVSELRKAAPVAMPRALDAELHAIRQDIPPDSHVVCRPCAVSPATVAGRLCACMVGVDRVRFPRH